MENITILVYPSSQSDPMNHVLCYFRLTQKQACLIAMELAEPQFAKIVSCRFPINPLKNLGCLWSSDFFSGSECRWRREGRSWKPHLWICLSRFSGVNFRRVQILLDSFILILKALLFISQANYRTINSVTDQHVGVTSERLNKLSRSL